MGARKGEAGLSNCVSLSHRCNPFDVFNPVKGRGTHEAFAHFFTSPEADLRFLPQSSIEQFWIAWWDGNPYNGGHVRFPPNLGSEGKQSIRPNYSPFANKMPNNSAHFSLDQDRSKCLTRYQNSP